MNNIQQKITVAKALRSSFNEAQSDVLKSTFMNDEYLIKQIRKAQEEYKIFKELVEEIKEENEEEYRKHIIGF